MTIPTANGLPVLEATIWMPQRGAWIADIVADGETELTGAVSLKIDGVEFKGAAKHASVFEGRSEARIVGGAGGLHTELPPKFWQDVPVSVPLQSLLSACGETLASSSTASVTAKKLTNWTRIAAQASDELAGLAAKAGASWRILGDGTLWFGAETWPTLTVDHELLSEQPVDGALEVAPASPELRPGVTFLGRRVSHVTHRLTSSKLRTQVHLESAGSPLGRLRAAIESLVRVLVAPARYYGLYEYKVVAQSGQKLELSPLDARMPALSSVPIRYGLPGFTVMVPGGARVLVGFRGGEPDKPFAELWDGGSVTEIVFDEGGQPVSRQGDLVQVGGVGTVVSFAPLTPAPLPAMLVGVPYLISFSPIPPTPALASPLFGSVATGKANFKA